ncbi:hypothetical protein [Anaerococcus degeneri]|uniref:Uncharacterized protein n=1 Tax=Anaerococcus degeneri TaxID=361500 RepID=A0ABS7YZ93_9FIRM|nr:hypothetical protein [Anaerococcus degeneri]MBP2014832.1 hypothetical protein [Anaerococcus degeneri]MCA2097041.1 hypothetical protein [Anaerococcus degeneri]
MQRVFETIFDIFYLGTVIFLGTKMLKEGKFNKAYYLFGIMALVLGFGDAFHLVPRAIALNTTGLKSYTRSLGLGKLITSITMTIFYLILYYVWRERYKIGDKKGLTLTIWTLAVLRILLVLCPENKFLTTSSPLTWGIYRNIPFTIMGLIIIVIFYQKSRERKDTAFKNLWLTIVLSFGFYLPVVLFEQSLPAIGALMVPKTCAYIWTILIGYKAMKGDKHDKKIL